MALRYDPPPEAYFRGEDPLAIVAAIPGLIHLEVAADAPADAVSYDPFRCALKIAAVAQASLAEVKTATRLVADQVELAVVDAGPAVEPVGLQLRTLRVDAANLDAVAALVNELVIAKNALTHETRRLSAELEALGHGRRKQARALVDREAAIERVVADLHGAVTRLRLAPLGHLFSRFPRQVREIADGLGKPVDFQVSGEDVALDKEVLEGLFEPILHLVRNAVDHGLEDPEGRRAARKPQRGSLAIAARSAGATVTIDVADDGRGLDIEAIRAKAVARGVLGPDAAKGQSDIAVADLVFAPGFSTAERVSELSGRGVGMDAVRAAVGRLGGTVSLHNRPGAGLTVRLTLPAQVLMTRVLVVDARGQRFAVPLAEIEAIHRVRSVDVTAVREGRAYVRDAQVIPLLRLSEMLGDASRPDDDVFPVLKVAAGAEAVGVQVDAIGDRIEAPMRPLGGIMTAYPGVLGTILQGDGRVLLVLDVAELAA
ncbi:MAG: chemotaxis protein CheW [Proteobacteria bacterium]|nr:chemotaxis protein CheW [Pseudomonadota bacterium]